LVDHWTGQAVRVYSTPGNDGPWHEAPSLSTFDVLHYTPKRLRGKGETNIKIFFLVAWASVKINKAPLV
jgi:hypothetical protein